MVGAPGLIVGDMINAPSSFPGQLGSIPLAPTHFVVKATRARQSFYRSSGDAIFHLNTAIVGLEQIAAGHFQHELTIKWPVPRDRRAAANQSRQLLLSGALLLNHSSFESYVQEIARDPLLPIDSETRGKIRKQVPKKNSQTNKTEMYSVFERTQLLMSALDIDDEVALAFVDAATVWRNYIVHKRANRKMDSSARGFLNKHADSISETHAGIDVRRMVKSLEEDANRPTLKETTTMIAFLIRTVGKIDEAFVKQVFTCESQVEAYALRIIVSKAQNGAKPFMKAHAAGKKKCRARLRQILIENGLREGAAAKAAVEAQHILRFAEMSRVDILKAFSLDLSAH
jgi:hypothetical protein